MEGWSWNAENNAIREKKKGTLLFFIHIEFLNVIWNCIKGKGYKVIPADLSIYRIGENLQAHNTTWVMLNSKDFLATGFDGKKAEGGIIELDHKKKEIKFKRKDF